MKIPQNRPAAASSYRGNPKRMAVRTKIRAAWLANPHLSADAIGEMCEVSSFTAQQSRPTSIKHALTCPVTTKLTTQDEITWNLYLEDKTLFEIAELTCRSLRTTKRAIARMQRDRLLQSLQTTNP